MLQFAQHLRLHMGSGRLLPLASRRRMVAKVNECPRRTHAHMLVAAIIAFAGGLTACGSDEEGAGSCEGPELTGAPTVQMNTATIGQGTVVTIGLPVSEGTAFANVGLQPDADFAIGSLGFGSTPNDAGADWLEVSIDVNNVPSAPGRYYPMVQLSDRTGADPNVRGSSYVRLSTISTSEYALLCNENPVPQHSGLTIPFLQVQ